MQNYFFKYLVLLFVLGALVSNLVFAQEEVYPYSFRQDTVLAGRIVADGRIFEGDKLNFVSISNTFNYENLPPSLVFYDEFFNVKEKLGLTSTKSAIMQNIVAFDFDGDLFDEVIYTIRDPNKLSFVYFDPSNKPRIKKTIFEIPIKGKYLNLKVNVTPIQLDNDSFYEILITSSEQIIRAFTKPGIWAVDVENGKLLWEKLLAANPTKTDIITFVNEGVKSIIYTASSANMPASDFYFSNGYYHFINKYKNETTIYNKNFKRIKEPIWNTHSKDFESDSISYIASIDTKGKINWKIDLGLNPSELNVSLIDNFSKNKLILSYFSSNTTKIKILDAKSGAIEKVKKLEKRQSVNLVDSTIYIMKNRQITTMNLDLEILDSVTTDFRNKLLAATFFDHNPLVLIIEGSSIVQSLSAFESNLDKVANIDAQGVIYYLSNSKYISLFNSATKKSTLLSFHAVNWYNKITAETLRTLVISFLIIITFVMVLWISTLRVSSKKIKQQKDELEESHAELKETTDKLIEVEKLAVYGTIAGSIAHEINSPLGAIINSAQRIKEDKNADIQKNIALIEKAGKRSKSIIEKLLVGTPNSHIDSNSDLVEVINDWKALSAQQFDNLGITIQTQIDCNSKLAISSTELNQILTNLLFNARDSIMESNNPVKTIVIESHQEHKKCLISIYDTGTGFSKSKLENPFEAFKTSKKRGQGTGLGLWVIKRIIDEVGGEIKILNCDVGAKVEITIPEYIDKENDKN